MALRSPRLRVAALLAGIGLAVMSLWAAAQGSALSAADTRSVQQVVRAQLDAFAADDAHKAFALADAEVRNRFGNAQDFLAMVRAHYPMVHRPASVSFLKPESDGGLAVQRVRVADGDGGHWLVTYLLQKPKQERQWRISACIVVPDAPRLTT